MTVRNGYGVRDAALLLAGLAVVAITSRAEDWQPAWLVVALVVVAFLVNQNPVRERAPRLTLGSAVTGLALALLGPGPALLCALWLPLGGPRPWPVVRTDVSFALFWLAIGIVVFEGLTALAGDGAAVQSAATAVALLAMDFASFVMAVSLGPFLSPRLPLRRAFATFYVPASAGVVGSALLTAYAVYLAMETSLVAGLGTFLLALAVLQRILASLMGARELAFDRARLLEQALSARDVERRRLAGALHDGPLQTLLFVRQQLDEEGRLRDTHNAVATTVDELRGIVSDLYPLAPAGDLASVLRLVVGRLAERGGLRHTIDIDPAASGVADEVVVAIVRELVTNVVRHADAQSVHVAVSAHDAGAVSIDVADDGVGMGADRLEQAIRDGHFGLAAARERVHGLGGRMSIGSADAGGTRVHVEVPMTAGASVGSGHS